MGSLPPCGEGLGKGVPQAPNPGLTPLPGPPPHPPSPEGGLRRTRGGGEWRERAANHGEIATTKHHAAFDAAANDAKPLPSAASRFSSGAGSSEGSFVSLA